MGIKLHVVTAVGGGFPFNKHPEIYDVICTITSVYGSSLLNDVEFHNFKSEYSGGFNQCSGAFAFGSNPGASDATAGTYLRNVECTECERTAYAKFLNPKRVW